MTTYSDAVTRARAAYAVGMNKKARSPEWNNAYNSNVMAQEMMDWDKNYKAKNDPANIEKEMLAWDKGYKADRQAAEEEQARVAAQYTDQMNGIVNRAKGEQAVRDIADQKAAEEQARTAARYIDQMNGIVNRAKGEEASRQAAAAKDYLENQVPQNITDAQILKKLQLGYPLTPEEQERGMSLMSEITAQTADENQKGIDATVASNTAKRNLGIGIGAGLAGGAAVGAGAYGLAGLFPSLRKRRLLRALMALTAGGAAGAGIGYGVTKGLNSGKIG